MEFLAKELAEATRNYGRASIIGKGGYSTVYKGSLRYSTVAIKVLSQVKGLINSVTTAGTWYTLYKQEGRQALLRTKPSEQFQTEVSVLSR